MEHVSASTAPQLGCTNLWDGDGSVLRCLGHGRGTKATAVPTAWLPAPAPAHQSAAEANASHQASWGGFFPSTAYGRPEAVISVAPIWPAQRCIARHCTTLHSTALHCTAQYCTAQHRVALHSTTLHSSALLSTAPCCITLCCTA